VSTGVQTKSSYLVKLVVGIMLRYAGLEGCWWRYKPNPRRKKNNIIGLTLSDHIVKVCCFSISPFDPENIQVI